MEKIKPALNAAEIEQLKRNLKLTYKERFEMMTRLYKIQQTMKRASISHKPFIRKIIVVQIQLNTLKKGIIDLKNKF